MTLDLNDLGSITCSACGECFTAQQAIERFTASLRRWDVIAHWLGTAPTV
jgi:hypothetical protein